MIKMNFRFAFTNQKFRMIRAFEVTDFADAKEIKEQSFLWDKQIEDLKHAIGA